ncbi:MAG: VWA domain-containing protein [Thermoprotei archaeon]|nr:VWA domain-containing protein [Thermoprotei archaeon]
MRWAETRRSYKPKRSVIAGVGLIDEVRAYRGSRILDIASKLAGRPLPKPFTVELAVDVFYSFNLPMPIVDVEFAKRQEPQEELEELQMRLQVVSALTSSSNLWRVKPYTVADTVTSIVASASFIERLSRILSQESSGGSRGGEGRKDEGKGSRGESRFQDAVEKALEQVEGDVKTAKDIKRALSGLGAGKGSVLAFDESMEEVLRLARDTDISKVLEKIEGVKVPAVRSRVERYSKGWIEGVEVGGDLERLHYSQLALPWDYFLASFADSKLLLYKRVTTKSKGPIYVLMDKSGSMVGAKIDWARAVAVALLRKSTMEGRRFYARFFDSITHPPVSVKPNSRVSEIVSALSYLARVKAGGGTDISRALITACEDIVKEGGNVSDIVLISDGEDRISPELLSKTLNKANARLHTVMIQGHNVYLKQISYRYMAVRKLEAKEILKVVDFT